VTVVIVDLPDEPGPGIDAFVPRILTCEDHKIFEKIEHVLLYCCCLRTGVLS
jgi:hypothetical protein